jgi:hypothetical protein
MYRCTEFLSISGLHFFATDPFVNPSKPLLGGTLAKPAAARNKKGNCPIIARLRSGCQSRSGRRNLVGKRQVSILASFLFECGDDIAGATFNSSALIDE